LLQGWISPWDATKVDFSLIFSCFSPLLPSRAVCTFGRAATEGRYRDLGKEDSTNFSYISTFGGAAV